MKKITNTAFFYMILGLIGGVFFREFTKFNHFGGVTALGKLHVHLLMLGMAFFLIVLLLEHAFKLTQFKFFNRFYLTYNLGLILMVIMLAVRGCMQVLAVPLSSGANAAISGIAGISHIILAVGLFFFFSTLKKAVAHHS